MMSVRSDGLAQEDDESRKHYCEVLSVVRKYKETLESEGEDKARIRIQSFLLLVEKHRGSDSAQRLRNDALKLLKGDSHGNKT